MVSESRGQRTHLCVRAHSRISVCLRPAYPNEFLFHLSFPLLLLLQLRYNNFLRTIQQTNTRTDVRKHILSLTHADLKLL